MLDGQPVTEIYSDLTGRRGAAAVDLTLAQRLPENAGVAFMGDTKGGAFDIQATSPGIGFVLPRTRMAARTADVLQPWLERSGRHAPASGTCGSSISAGKWVKQQAALYEQPFAYVTEHVAEAIGAGDKRRSRMEGEAGSYRLLARHVEPRPANAWSLAARAFRSDTQSRQAPNLCLDGKLDAA